MNNVGKVLPRYVDLGSLKPKIGSFEIGRVGEKKIPLRYVQYSPISNSGALLSWETITVKRLIEVSPDSTLELDGPVLNAFINPENDVPGALFVNRVQIKKDVLDHLQQIGRMFKKEIDQYPMVVLVPELRANGKNIFCFDLPMTGTGQKEITDFAGGTVEEVSNVFLSNDNLVLFVNPYFQQQLKTS